MPRVDQRQMYRNVFDRLDAGRAVGIFPEGGSHDRAALLPLKAGVSLRALGALARNRELTKTLRIVPVGLNYYRGHRFRGSVFVEYGEPIRVPPGLVDAYAAPAQRGERNFSTDGVEHAFPRGSGLFLWKA